jgi:serine/threonine protein kinase
VIEFVIRMTEGLRKAHEKGIVHRDIKSANIMVNYENQVKIMDFGLTKLTGQAGLTKHDRQSK